ncbi:MAG: RluA family pseudouridine synthase, partial [Myxococcales bacterium]|nr:RluA family pseudouridine synthase [Myxococcales bacterium]
GGAATADDAEARARRRAEGRRLYPWLPDDADLGLDAHLDRHGRPHVVQRRFEVTVDFAGWRLDHYLKHMIPRLSRTRIQAVIDGTLQHLGGRTPKPAMTVAAGDVFVIHRDARPEPPCPRHVEVLHDEPAFVVVDKPAGLPVHASAKFYFNTLTRVLLERFGEDAPQICHRLDRETSGALVCARGRDAAARIKGAFAAKKVAKTYLAIVTGQPPWPEEDDRAADVLIDIPLALAGVDDDTELPGVRMVPRAGGLPSATRVRVLRRAGRHALVRCTPITGRQHQIRAHLAFAGFPIVGDKLYGHGDTAFRRFCDQGLTPDLAVLFGLPRQALHAAAVEFPHPEKPETVRVVSPLAPELRDFLDRADHGS